MSLPQANLLSFALLIVLLVGCNRTAPAENQAPTVTLLEPTERSFVLGDEVKMQAEASDPDGSISNVTFYVDGVEVGTDAEAPYLYTFTPAVAKAHILAAQAYDDQGAVDTSASVTVEVSAAADLYTLTVDVFGNGTVTSEPVGIACPEVCRARFEVGQAVTLSALADAGSNLVALDGACSGTKTTCTFTQGDASDTQVSATFQVITPSPNSVTVVAAGDVSCGDYSPEGSEHCHDQQTADLVTDLEPDLVLMLGDSQYDPSTYQDFLNYYDKSWGAFKAITRPAVGNHEYDSPTPNAEGYFQYFGAAAGDPLRGYYSFDSGAWHVVVLNTNDDCTIVACGSGSAQEQWLRADLAENSQLCTLAVMHHPRYNSGNHGNAEVTQDLWRALYEAEADLVLAAHAHHYERFAPQDADGTLDTRGLRLFVVGTGGKSLKPSGPPIDNSEKVIDGTYGVLELTLNRDAYDWRFVPEAGNSASDTGSSSCH